jgi:polyisoprenoid-binding protein YceI
MRSLSLTAFTLLLLPPGIGVAQTAAPRETTPMVWQIDAGHSDISFRIRHFMSRVRGTFREWEGAITGDSTNWADASVRVTIQTSSIDTGHERRDNDLRSDNFFDAANHPTITFQSTRVEVQGAELRITGNLTMHGVTRPVVLTGQFLGSSPSGQGRTRIGFEASTTLDRTDYGVIWNRALEGGGVMLGDEVEIDLAVEAVRRP